MTSTGITLTGDVVSNSPSIYLKVAEELYDAESIGSLAFKLHHYKIKLDLNFYKIHIQSQFGRMPEIKHTIKYL